ncbi:MAG: hypothetical protein IJ725_00950 [Ruminococcus sp.]|nr:hypothetical protein [Ruminococcus sp.]
MSKKIFAGVSILLVLIMALCSMTAFAADDDTAGIPKDVEDISDILEVTDETGDSDFVPIPDPTQPSDNETRPTEDETEPATQEIAYKAGDVNGDGEIDVNDVTTYQLTLAGKLSVTEAFTKNCNTVTDQKRNIIDVTAIQFYLAGTFKRLPVTPDGYYAEIIRP